MKTIIIFLVTLLSGSFILITSLQSCNPSASLETKHIQQTPRYSQFRFRLGDTISFALAEYNYNRIAASSYFKCNDTTYLAFYDKGSKSILVYDFKSKIQIMNTRLAKWVKNSKLDKANVIFKNFDSIFVTTQSDFYLLDSAGKVYKQIEFFKQRGHEGTVSNTEPPILKGKYLYIGVKPNISEKSLIAHRKWRTLYKINIESGEKEMVYPLPPLYHTNLYGYSYLEYSYCINDKGNFVFSFAADSNIYETDVDSFQISYNAQSRFHKGLIPSMTKEQIMSTDSYQTYAIQDSYGPLLYDPNSKLYFRQAKQGGDPEDVKAKIYSKKRSIIILDQNFRIIGEQEYNDEFSFSSIFFTPEGKSYTRINYADESALHFAELFIDNGHHQIAVKK
jgi:hypothetical protein